MLRLVYTALIFSASLFMLTACQQSSGKSEGAPSTTTAASVTQFSPTTAWNAYWYDGKAELTSFTLEQSRYGEIHSGTVVNIFVTEDFSKEKQVKLDDPSRAGKDKLPILKMNQSVKFNTGIYPYSLMLSSYQPVDLNNYANAVKISGSMQEWCGMAYFQLNEQKGKYAIESRSYFESEGDQNITTDKVMQEDAIWNMIRISPDKLPLGDITILPGAFYLRLAHKPIAPVAAKATMQNNNGVQEYTITIPSLDRSITYQFESEMPYRILGWTDAFPGFDGVKLTTTAKRNKELKLDYWRTHNVADRVLRDQLGLPRDSQ